MLFLLLIFLFSERERLRARGRIKALREDPTFRQLERAKDKDRRRKARLLNQNQRLKEKERDKMRKSMMRKIVNHDGGSSTCISSNVNINDEVSTVAEESMTVVNHLDSQILHSVASSSPTLS